MAFANASGTPVKSQPVTLQLDLPCEAASPGSIGTINWMGVISAVIQLAAALQSGDMAQIVAAIQALVKAITGN